MILIFPGTHLSQWLNTTHYPTSTVFRCEMYILHSGIGHSAVVYSTRPLSDCHNHLSECWGLSIQDSSWYMYVLNELFIDTTLNSGSRNIGYIEGESELWWLSICPSHSWTSCEMDRELVYEQYTHFTLTDCILIVCVSVIHFHQQCVLSPILTLESSVPSRTYCSLSKTPNVVYTVSALVVHSTKWGSSLTPELHHWYHSLFQTHQHWTGQHWPGHAWLVGSIESLWQVGTRKYHVIE